jgi:hypothetical protein
MSDVILCDFYDSFLPLRHRDAKKAKASCHLNLSRIPLFLRESYSYVIERTGDYPQAK